jgi:hypothetical protein
MPVQVEIVCGQLSKMPELKHGFNAIGFSQGGQFLRVSAGCSARTPAQHFLISLCRARGPRLPALLSFVTSLWTRRRSFHLEPCRLSAALPR